MGTKIGADLSLLDGVRVGDWVIIHAGFAIARLDEAEARLTLSYLKEMAGPVSPAPRAKSRRGA
jgi:hydrogenase expression/formation protein HypC